MAETLPDPDTKVSLIRSTEQQLIMIRMRLEDAFAFLKIAHHASVVCIAASRQTSTDCDEEVATILFNVVSHHIDRQMRAISSIVEELGGRTEFTEGREQLQDLFDKVNSQGQHAKQNPEDEERE